MESGDKEINILLFGISNVGKSTTGCLLAERLGYRYYDLDEEVKSRCHMTLEKFVHTVWPYERDKIRGEIIGKILQDQCPKVIAVTPMYYTIFFSKYLKRDDLLAIELQDTPENIFERLVFSDENDQVYKDNEYRDAHRAYYLKEIKKDITYYKKSFSRIANKFQMNNETPEEVVRHLMEQFNLYPRSETFANENI